MTVPVTVYYHADCLDGFGAAYAAWRRYGDAARYLPIHYGERWQPWDVADREVFILDFSFPREALMEMAAQARAVQLIDHHVSARDMWQAWLAPDPSTGRECFRDPALGLGVAFDLKKSGARLAWEHFHPDAPLPRAIAHIEDQDLWRFQLPDTRAFCRALRLHPFDFTDWDAVVRAADSPGSALYHELCVQGRAIERFLQAEVARLAGGALVMPVTLRGEPADPLQAARHGETVLTDGAQAWLPVAGLAVNANVLFASEFGHRLAEQSGSFGLVWQLAGDGQAKVSLRACGHLNVAAVAERYGGGGHPNAAGFRMPAWQFVEEVLAPSWEKRQPG